MYLQDTRLGMGAWLLVIFLLPITIMMHNFWNVADPNRAMLQQIMFLKNLSILGGALLIAYFGSGSLRLCLGNSIQEASFP